MRKIIVLSFISLDGVMQAPGGPEEDTSSNFKHGGWVVPYFDEFLGEVMGEQMKIPFDLLLGRKTFEIFAPYWSVENDGDNSINKATKYVVSNTIKKHTWQKSVFFEGDKPIKIKELKSSKGPDLQVHGSGELIQLLMKHDLVDEFWLKIFPVTLGSGKKLFAAGTIPAKYTLIESKSSPNGVIVASLKRTGDLETGTFGT